MLTMSGHYLTNLAYLMTVKILHIMYKLLTMSINVSRISVSESNNIKGKGVSFLIFILHIFLFCL